MNPKKLFSSYQEGYKYKYINKQEIEGKSVHVIELFPIENTEFIKIELAIEKHKNMLYKSCIFDKNGSTYSYIITSFISNGDTPDFNFNTTNYPNIEIIDLR